MSTYVEYKKLVQDSLKTEDKSDKSLKEAFLTQWTDLLSSPKLVSWDIETPAKPPTEEWITLTNTDSIAPSPVWDMTSGRALVSRLQTWSRSYGYHVCLGGSVLNKGQSAKDIDIYFLPLNNGNPPAPVNLVRKLQFKLKSVVTPFTSKEYPERELPYILKGKMSYQDKRIDIFVMGSQGDWNTLYADTPKWMLSPDDLIPKDRIDLAEDQIIHHKRGRK